MATSRKFTESYARSQEVSFTEARRAVEVMEDAFKAYLSDMKVGDSFKFCGVCFDLVEVPARDGKSYLTGESWHKEAHNRLKVHLPRGMQNYVLD